MIKMNIWGRTFEMDIIYDCYTGETVTDYQRKALKLFLDNAEKLLSDTLPKVKEYCLSRNKEDIGENRIDNIFRYVMPKALYVKRNKKEEHIVALDCAYRLNLDEGLAIVFKNNVLEEIGTEGIL